MRRPTLPSSGLLPFALLAGLGACGFPDLAYDGDSGGATDATPDAVSDVPSDAAAMGDAGDASTSEAALPLDGTTGSDASEDAPVDVALNEAGAVDAPADVLDEPPAADASGDAPHDASSDAPSSVPDAGHDAGIDCDQDKDGYKAAGASCGGNDCCDTDFNANPGQTTYFTSPDDCGSFDYNCDGKYEPGLAINITCTGLSVTGCPGGPGFTNAPACGSTAPYSNCAASGLSCQTVADGTATQSCH